jgi:hypothetical protein
VRRLGGIAAAFAGLLTCLSLAAPATGASVTKSIVDHGEDRVCNDGFGNSTTNATWVRTKSGSVKVSCHFDQDETNWPDGTKINVFTFGDCAITDFNGNTIVLNSRFRVNSNGTANMTCN